MSNNTEWAELAGWPAPTLVEPGQFEDNNGSKNDRPCLLVGECAIEGTAEQWQTLGVELLAHFGEPAAPGGPKRCVKCSGPIPSPVLGDDMGERCPLCGDEPPTGAELGELLAVAIHPLIVFRDRVLDVDGLDDDDPLRDAAEALDRGFDELDSCLRWLEGADEVADDAVMAAWFVAWAGGDNDRAEELRFWWTEGYSEARYGTDSPIHPDDMVLRRCWRRGARAGLADIKLAP